MYQYAAHAFDLSAELPAGRFSGLALAVPSANDVFTSNQPSSVGLRWFVQSTTFMPPICQDSGRTYLPLTGTTFPRDALHPWPE